MAKRKKRSTFKRGRSRGGTADPMLTWVRKAGQSKQLSKAGYAKGRGG